MINIELQNILQNINGLLFEIYGGPTLISDILKGMGCTPAILEKIKHKHLEAYLKSLMAHIIDFANTQLAPRDATMILNYLGASKVQPHGSNATAFHDLMAKLREPDWRVKFESLFIRAMGDSHCLD
ncbi:hypothetical protein JW877_03975 [bacterium]|nr:hypothetical protein [bacterium]